MLTTLFGSRTRVRVIQALLADTTRRYRLRELVREVGCGTSGVQKELARLEGLGLVASERIADARFVSVDAKHPLVGPLRVLLALDASAQELVAREAEPSETGIAAPAMQRGDGSVIHRAGAGAAPRIDAAVAARLHPAVRWKLGEIAVACLESGVLAAAVTGAAVTSGSRAPLRDLEITVRFAAPVSERPTDRYFSLIARIERITGVAVYLSEDAELSIGEGVGAVGDGKVLLFEMD